LPLAFGINPSTALEAFCFFNGLLD